MSAEFLAAGAASVLRCPSCAATQQPGDGSAECGACGALVEVVHGAPDVNGSALAERFAARRGSDAAAERSGVWRFRELVMPGSANQISWPEGNTPLIGREAVREYAGVADVLLKHEGMNPTGSFKDRGMTVAVTDAVRSGATAVACASTGNTAASLAAYAAQAGLPARRRRDRTSDSPSPERWLAW